MNTLKLLALSAVWCLPLAAQNPVLRDISCADAGATDAYACNALVSPGAYSSGLRYMFKANTANTGAASFNLNAIGPITIKKVVGGITTDLATNDIRAGQWVLLTHDGTNFQMQSALGNAPPVADTVTSISSHASTELSDTAGLVRGAAGLTTNNKLVEVSTTDGALQEVSNQTANYLYGGPISGGAAAPAFRALVSADIPNNAADTSGTAAKATALASDPADCSANQFANSINASGTLGCAALALAGAQFANQGSITTVLHGNAAGNPSFGAIVTGDITDGTVASADLAAANKTQIKSIALFDPVAGDSGRIQMMFPTAVTITRVACATKTATSTVTLNLDERAAATPDTAGTNVLSAGLVCDTGQQTSCAAGCDVNTITNASIASRVPLALTISAVANTPTDVRVHVEYTID